MVIEEKGSFNREIPGKHKARLVGKAGGQGWRARLAGKAGGQGWRARLAGKAGGQGWRASMLRTNPLAFISGL